MDTTLRLSEGASVLDVYDHEEEEGGERDINDEFDDEEDEEEYDEDEYLQEEGGLAVDDDTEEEEELEDDVTRATKPLRENEKEEYGDDVDDARDVFLLRQFEEEEGENEEEKNQQVDPSLLALAAAQQENEIITNNTPSVSEERSHRTASGEIKKKVYDFLMTSKTNTSAPSRKTPSPPISYATPANCSIPPAPPSDRSSYVPSPENVRPPSASSPQPSKEAQIDRSVSSSTNDSDGLAGDYYSFLMEGHDSETEGKEDSFPEGIPSRSSISDGRAAEKYPIEFSADLIHNYDGVYGQSSVSSQSRQILPLPSPKSSTTVAVNLRSVPDAIFPSEREVSEQSITMAAKEKEAFLLHDSSPPSIMPLAPAPSSPTLPKKTSDKPPSVLPDVFSKVNDVLGGKAAIKKIDDNMEAAVLKAKVQMLRDTTKDLRCSHMVDIIFGAGDIPKKPSPGDLKCLKNIIAGELTLNEFIKSSKVTDISSAELFRRSNENLEMVQRQQIMSNPLFSEISSASSLVRRVRHTARVNQEVAVEKGEEKEEAGGEGREEVAASNTIISPDNNLRMELWNLLKHTPGEKKDPCLKLSDRVSFLNRLIHHKTANNISWTRLVNLISSIASQAAVVLFGDGDEQYINNREETTPEWTTSQTHSTTSSKLMAMNGKKAVKDMNMSSIGVDLLFGAASDMLERNMSRVCVDIGELALYLNIPLVLLQWPEEFIRTDEYKNILMRSISSFSTKMTIPSMYVIDQIMLDGEEEEKTSAGEDEQHDLELFSERDKKASINKLYSEIRFGRQRERELMRCIFHGQQQQQQQQQQHQTMSSSSAKSSNSLCPTTAYYAAASIIDYKIPVFDNMTSSVIKYLNKRKHLISAAVMKLLKKAKLNITVYCIKNKLNNVSARCNKKLDNEEVDDAPMQNLMYRSSALPVNAGKKGRDTVAAWRRRGAQASLKRPPPKILSSRIKRLKEWETASTDESELSDEDTDSVIRDG